MHALRLIPRVGDRGYDLVHVLASHVGVTVRFVEATLALREDPYAVLEAGEFLAAQRQALSQDFAATFARYQPEEALWRALLHAFDTVMDREVASVTAAVERGRLQQTQVLCCALRWVTLGVLSSARTATLESGSCGPHSAHTH